MAIFVNSDTRVIVQGMTGRSGTFYTDQSARYAPCYVGGVRPGKGGSQHLDLPMFNSVKEAMAETGANASMVIVPAPYAGDAMIEAIEAGGVKFVDCLKRFRDDDETEAVVLIGEIGGREEEEAAAYLASLDYGKPVIALVVGRFAPRGRQMGHAGTLSVLGGGTAQDKISCLRNAGAVIAENADDVVAAVKRAQAAS
jgi:succinyl-CoA synthetase alpha subunit